MTSLVYNGFGVSDVMLITGSLLLLDLVALVNEASTALETKFYPNFYSLAYDRRNPVGYNGILSR